MSSSSFSLSLTLSVVAFFLVLTRFVCFELDDGLLLSSVFVLPEVDGYLVGLLVLHWACSLIFD